MTNVIQLHGGDVELFNWPIKRPALMASTYEPETIECQSTRMADYYLDTATVLDRTNERLDATLEKAIEAINDR